MTSFLVTWFLNVHILRNLPKAISLQSFNAVNCLGQVLQRDYKNTMMTSLWHHFILLGFEIPHFVKLIISYQPAKFQIPQLSESNFTEVGIRHPKDHYDVIMTSLHNVWFSKLHTWWNLIEAVSLVSFIGLGCLDQLLWAVVDNTPQTYTLSKSPVLIGLMWSDLWAKTFWNW